MNSRGNSFLKIRATEEDFDMKKLLALLFALMLIVTGCAGNELQKGDIDGKTDGSQSVETAAPEEAKKTLADVMKELPERNFEGYEFTVITRDPANIYWFTRDVFSEGMDGEPINDAVYERNTYIEEKYNVVIKDMPAISPTDKAKTLILAGETFTAVTDGLSALATTLVVNNWLADYNAMPGIKLENVWWDQAMNSDLSVKHKLYFVTGDISIMDNEGTWNILFNKVMITDFSLESPYELVYNNAWTITKMHEYALIVSTDLDGDGKMTYPNDRFGLASEEFNNYAFWVGGGMKITNKDKDDVPYLTVYSEKSANVLEKAVTLNNDKNVFFNHNRNSMDNGMYNILFTTVGMRILPVFRKTDIDFGILPLPKYDESQEKYYTTYSPYNLTAYSVPVSALDLERTGILLEAMAAISYYTLTPAYYEISLKGKMLRDNESGLMIDMILANRAYDMGQVFNWGGGLQMIMNITDAATFDFSSKYNALESKAISEIEKFIEEIS